MTEAEFKDLIVDAVYAMADVMGGYAVPMCEFPDDGTFTVFGDQTSRKCFTFTVNIKEVIDDSEEQP